MREEEDKKIAQIEREQGYRTLMFPGANRAATLKRYYKAHPEDNSFGAQMYRFYRDANKKK